MAPSAPVMYGLAMQSLWEARINIAVDPMKLMLVGDGYVPNQNTHKFKSVITNEIVGSGYAAGGAQITGAGVAYNATTKILTLSGGPVSWPDVTWTDARYAIGYMAPASYPDTLCPLLFYVDLGVDESPADQAFYVGWNAAGIITQGVI